MAGGTAFATLSGSSLFSNVLAASGSSAALIQWVAGFDVSPYVMLLMMFGILLLLGMFMDQLAMMLLTVPIFFRSCRAWISASRRR